MSEQIAAIPLPEPVDLSPITSKLDRHAATISGLPKMRTSPIAPVLAVLAL